MCTFAKVVGTSVVLCHHAVLEPREHLYIFRLRQSAHTPYMISCAGECGDEGLNSMLVLRNAQGFQHMCGCMVDDIDDAVMMTVMVAGGGTV